MGKCDNARSGATKAGRTQTTNDNVAIARPPDTGDTNHESHSMG